MRWILIVLGGLAGLAGLGGLAGLAGLTPYLARPKAKIEAARAAET